MVKRVYKYGTGADIPEDAVYLWSCKNGKMPQRADDYMYVWHYFLVECAE